METEDVSQYRPRSSKTGQPVILPELDIFVHLLILLRMLDEKRMEKVKILHNTHQNFTIILLVQYFLPRLKSALMLLLKKWQ